MNIDFRGHNLFLHRSGALFWPEEKLLIVSDLHLEKGSHFAGRGYFLPPYDSSETLKVLLSVCDEMQCERILLLGDCFHDEQGHARLGPAERAQFDRLIGYNPIWIRGNHDRGFSPEGFSAMDDFAHRGLIFRHIASDGEGEISGHYHPKADLILQGGRVSRPCFIEDGVRMIVPAFGAYTGGLSVSHPSIASIFSSETRLHLLGRERVYSLYGAEKITALR